MNTYYVTARTVKEAYAIANAKYADDKHEVSCEVVEMPKKGFLGIGAKEAKIKVTVTETTSADLGSLVSDMRDMKKYTDRDGGDAKNNQSLKNQSLKNQSLKNQSLKNQPQKNQQPKSQSLNNQQNRQNQKSGKGEQQKPQSNNQQNRSNNGQKQGQLGLKDQPGLKDQLGQKVQNQQRSQKPDRDVKKPEEKAAQPTQPTQTAQPEQKQRSALKNSAKPNVRPQIKHVDSDNVSGASVTVSSPVGLKDFVPDGKKSSFGTSNRSGGSMSNDIRKKRPAKPMMAADKADEKMRASKYDVAESDDDYKSLKSMELENEALLERKAGAALGFGEDEIKAESEIETEAPAAVAAEARKKEAATQAEMDYALEFANTLLSNMNIKAQAVACECPEGEEFITTDEATVYPKIEIVGEETGIIIGHHGETLDAVQYLVNLSAIRKTKSKDGDYVKIVVDTENYREKRADTLRSLARRMAAKAVKYKRNVFLEPMNAYERRIIHSELQNYPNVSTHSVGTDRDRKIIITYEGADKQPDNKNRRRRDRRPNYAKNAEKVGKQQTSEQSPAENDAEHAERRRPRKIQKVPIENLKDILDGGSFIDGVKGE